MDQFKLVMNWNQEEFAQWALAAKQKEEDNMALEQYQRQDEVKIRDVTLQLEKLSTEGLKRRRELASEVTETQAAQIELNKTAEDFRQLHSERQDLVQQWDTAVAAMHRRYACDVPPATVPNQLWLCMSDVSACKQSLRRLHALSTFKRVMPHGSCISLIAGFVLKFGLIRCRLVNVKGWCLQPRSLMLMSYFWKQLVLLQDEWQLSLYWSAQLFCQDRLKSQTSQL